MFKSKMVRKPHVVCSEPGPVFVSTGTPEIIARNSESHGQGGSMVRQAQRELSLSPVCSDFITHDE